MKKKINLTGHDDSKKWLEQHGDNEYKLCGELVEYSRFGLKESYFSFVDPPGGPMIHIGTILPETNEEVKEIILSDKKEIIIKV